MKCKWCGVEMLVDRVEVQDVTRVFHYKCPNKQCSHYGYGDSKETKKEEKTE